MGRVMRKGTGRHDTCFRVICIWNLRQDGGSLMVGTFKEPFLRFQLLFPDFYHFHHVIWGMKWAKKLKTKNGQNMSSGPFSHDAAHIAYGIESSGSVVVRTLASQQSGLGSIPRLDVICGLSLLVLFPALRGSSRVFRFFVLLKNLYLIWSVLISIYSVRN